MGIPASVRATASGPRPSLIGRTPVTNREYARFLAATIDTPPPWWSDARFDHPEQPVVGVNWADAVAYCDVAVSRNRSCPSPAHRSRVGEGGPRRTLRGPLSLGRRAPGSPRRSIDRRSSRETPANPFGLARPLRRLSRVVPRLGGWRRTTRGRPSGIPRARRAGREKSPGAAPGAIRTRGAPSRIAHRFRPTSAIRTTAFASCGQWPDRRRQRCKMLAEGGTCHVAGL